MKKIPALRMEAGDGLLEALLKVPSLPAYIQRLPAVTLDRLIERVGLEDCGELLQTVGSEKMNEVLAVSLWTRSAMGKTDALNVSRFVQWVQTWLLDGEETMARRVADMEDELLVCLLKELFQVRIWGGGNISDDDNTGDGNNTGDEVDLVFEEYRIYRSSERHWYVVEEMLMTMWARHPDFTLRLLGRCEQDQSAATQVSSGIGSDARHEDLAYAREIKRAQAGYVDPVAACAFLIHARSHSLAELRDQRAYDFFTAEYFVRQARNLQRQSASPARSDGRRWLPRQIANDQDLTDSTKDGSGLIDRGAATATPEEFAVLDSILRDEGIIGYNNGSRALLAAPGGGIEESDSKSSTLIERAIVQLARHDPVVSSQRLVELAYLSNIVVVDMKIQGREFSESDAARFAVATANLGACWLLDDMDMPGDPLSSICRVLESEPGIVRLFQIGYQLLCEIPEQCAQALERVLRSRPRRSAVINLIRQKQYSAARSAIERLADVSDNATCVALNILVDSSPCFPSMLDGQAMCSMYVDKSSRYVGTTEDLQFIADFLDRLQDLFD